MEEDYFPKRFTVQFFFLINLNHYGNRHTNTVRQIRVCIFLFELDLYNF